MKMLHKPFIFFLLMTSSYCLYAAGAAGTILFAKNSVKKGTQSVNRGDSFNIGDTISTGPNSAAQLKYTNGTLVRLSADTEYKVVSYDPNNKELQSEAFLTKGKMDSTTLNQEKAVLKTPVVALAILGTVFSVVTTDKETTARVTSGVVKTMGDNPITIGPGQSTEKKVFVVDANSPGNVNKAEPTPLSSIVETQNLMQSQIVNTIISTPEKNIPPVWDPCQCPPNCPVF